MESNETSKSPNNKAKIIDSGEKKQETEKLEGKKRKICERCNRPLPRTCICEALPEQRIRLDRTTILVLQHPHEIKMKNRSIPILELCLEPASLVLCVGRRLGEIATPEISKLLEPPNLPILLFPGDEKQKEGPSNVLSLVDVKEKIATDNLLLPKGGRIVLLALDATWRFAKEMNRANIEDEQYPPHMLRVSLQPQDLPPGWTSGRFNIRTTPTDSSESASSTSSYMMSTAECIALAVSKLEKADESSQSKLYSDLMKPLDFMVAKWNSFVREKKIREKKPPKKKAKH